MLLVYAFDYQAQSRESLHACLEWVVVGQDHIIEEIGEISWVEDGLIDSSLPSPQVERWVDHALRRGQVDILPSWPTKCGRYWNRPKIEVRPSVCCWPAMCLLSEPVALEQEDVEAYSLAGLAVLYRFEDIETLEDIVGILEE